MWCSYLAQILLKSSLPHKYQIISPDEAKPHRIATFWATGIGQKAEAGDIMVESQSQISAISIKKSFNPVNLNNQLKPHHQYQPQPPSQQIKGDKERSGYVTAFLKSTFEYGNFFLNPCFVQFSVKLSINWLKINPLKSASVHKIVRKWCHIRSWLHADFF